MKRNLWTATLLVALLFVIDVSSGGALHRAVRAGGSYVSLGFERAASAVAGSGFFATRASLEAQNRALRSQLVQYELRAAGVAYLQAQNAQLSAAAHLASFAPGITAPVVSSVISSPYGSFLIGAGSEDGVVVGSLVQTDGGFIVGVVVDESAHVATVQEVFAPSATIDTVIDGAPVAVAGQGGGNAQANVSRSLPVSVGDPVLAPKFSQLPVGVVGSVASSSASATQTLYIRLPIPLSALQYVYVLAPRT